MIFKIFNWVIIIIWSLDCGFFRHSNDIQNIQLSYNTGISCNLVYAVAYTALAELALLFTPFIYIYSKQKIALSYDRQERYFCWKSKVEQVKKLKYLLNQVLRSIYLKYFFRMMELLAEACINVLYFSYVGLFRRIWEIAETNSTYCTQRVHFWITACFVAQYINFSLYLKVTRSHEFLNIVRYCITNETFSTS